MPSESLPPDPLEAVPHPDAVRQRLAENLRESSILRGLLKLALRAEKERQQRRGHPSQRLVGMEGNRASA